MSERPATIALAPNPWFGPWKNRQQLLSRLAQRGWPIVYSTGPLSLWDRHQSKWQQAKLLGDFVESDGLVVDLLGRWLFRWPNLPLWDQMALRSSAKRLRGAMPGHSRRIAYLFHPSFLPLADFLGADFVVYHAFDLYSATIRA